MTLKLHKLLGNFIQETSLDIDVIGDGFALVRINFQYEQPKDYYGRCEWRFYNEAEPVTFYFNKRRDIISDLELLLPSELTFFIDRFNESQRQHKDIPFFNGFPLFQLINSNVMSDGFSFEEKGGIFIDYYDDCIVCSLRSIEFDTVSRVSDNVDFLFNQENFAGVKLNLNNQHKLLLQGASLI
ncbi:hypothetical protein [Paenibacillus graminis]|uniref:Uncharacterized protein n=1 Tax=Paenibacillus graminis TaxID=189425 RepID=A0A089M9K2_9BACL|nr:hypothetical protein [Paenibacillus graminis]AIQ69907.1 hypothetical protein PGRAT_21395 [Paenibacillus graminis]